MFKKGFNTYKFWRITVNIFTHDVVVVYIGKKGTYIRNIYKKDILKYSKALAMFMGMLITTSIIITIIPSDGATADNSYGIESDVNTQEGVDNEGREKVVADSDVQNIEDDEKLKNELLLSDKTDYSLPSENVPLKIKTYKVKSGESLNQIARKFGVSVDTICGSNNLTTYDNVPAGTVLRIPNKDGILYNMKEGNSITNLANKYRVPVEKILSENKFQNPDFVPVGELVFIPDAKPQNIFDGFLWPVGGRHITCGFGWRKNPFNRAYSEFHKGIDIAARYENVKASKYGKVTFSGWMGGYGYAVIIAHPGGWKSLYGHLSKIYVSEGQYVKQGQVIGKSGNTGRSTGPHLHFELIKQGGHTNPRKYLKK